VQDYIHAIEKELAAGNATEHTHRPALKTLVEGLAKGIVATNEPQRIECGAPDFLVTKGALQIGYIEAKDVGKSLDEAEKSEQLTRYRDSLSNLILTDYLEFRWYIGSERRLSARLGTLTKEGKIRRDRDGVQAVAKLLDNFLAHEAEGVGTPKELARHMARLAHRIREGVEEALLKGVASDLLSGLYKAFQETLIPGLKVTVFADMYAQTIAYGLFAARCETDKPNDFSRQKAAYLIPKTNPFLKALFEQITGTALDDEPYKWAVDELVQLLKKADMTEIVRGLSKGTGKDDPVVYFYEDFLREYDKKISEMRGVYYTPIPVVSYIVRSIDYLLKNTFSRSQGLADENTYILDPATGTGTFLYAVINEIYESLTRQGQLGQWDSYVTDHLLPRIFGFELLMTPYVIAHLKLGLKLKDTVYISKPKDRLGVYLTNTLEEAVKSSEMLMAQYIVKEANAAAEIKKEKKIMVVLGNPPYSGISANKGKWITDLINGIFNKDGHEIVKGYKRVDGQPLRERKLWLQDDYVKFIRFGQWRIESTGQGVLGYITNHAYLDNPTFRGMRQYLMDTFTDIYVLNLHGNVKKKKATPDGGKDENVFDIQQGVAIGIFVREPGKDSPAKVHYADMWGMQEAKYHALSNTDINTTEWTELQPNSPFYFFIPREEELRPEYEKGWKVTDIFPMNSVGAMSGHDFFVVSHTVDELYEKIDFLRGSATDDEVTQKYGLANHQNWQLSQARLRLKQDKDWDNNFKQYHYRPFDYRITFYTDYMFARSLRRYLFHMMHDNIALLTQRQTYGRPFQHFFVTKCISDLNHTSNLGGTSVFPLYLYPAKGEMQFEEGRRPNLNPAFIKDFSDKLGLKFVEDGRRDFKETLGPEDIFNYAYAVFHSLTYRSRYAEFLKIDFPRLPLTSDKELFRKLVEKGDELISLHVMELPVLDKLITKYPIPGSNVVENVVYDEPRRRVYINKTQFFEGITPEVWKFYIGIYQVCQKWLKDRKGRTLTYDELTHYQKVIVALKETIRLTEELDELIPGWPLE